MLELRAPFPVWLVELQARAWRLALVATEKRLRLRLALANWPNRRQSARASRPFAGEAQRYRRLQNGTCLLDGWMDRWSRARNYLNLTGVFSSV